MKVWDGVIQQDTETVGGAGEGVGAKETQNGEEGRSCCDGGERLVPVSEAIRYRKRAQAAEQRLDELKGQLEGTRAELEGVRGTVQKLERRQKIDEMLTESEAVDVEVARLLTEAAVELMEQPDIRLAVEDLRRQKPYLFRRRAGGATAMPAHGRGEDRGDASRAAERAVVSGDRRDLLRYLRLRRRAR
jgi:hypothetical protein